MEERKRNTYTQEDFNSIKRLLEKKEGKKKYYTKIYLKTAVLVKNHSTTSRYNSDEIKCNTNFEETI